MKHFLNVFCLGLLIVLSICFCVFCIEGCFWIVNTIRKKNINIEGDILSKKFFLEDAALGYKAQPNTRVTSILKEDGQIIYSAVYTTDNYGRRITPVKDTDNRSKKFALFFGCSYTFGEGLDDNETLPYFFSRLLPEYRAYNYGLSGYGPQQMLEHLKRETFRTEINEQDGILIYVFIDHHVNRVIGTMRAYSIWADIMPYYILDHKGDLIRKGSFRTGRPLLNMIYKLLNKSQVVQALQLDFPKLQQQHFEITAKIFEESKKIFQSKFKNGKFYVVFYPGSNYIRYLKPFFDQSGIQYIDCSKLFNPTLPPFHIPGDAHPNQNALKTLAEHLCTIIESD